MSKLPTDNLDAYNLVLKGRSFAEKSTKENLNIGIGFLTQATELDNQYADAYAELAYANLMMMYVLNSTERDLYINAAKKNNDIALRLDPNSVRANSTKGLIMTESNNKETRLEAEHYFNKALQLNPNDAISHLEISIFYNQQTNNKSKELYHARRAYELNPFAVDVIWNLAQSLMENNLIDEAKSIFDKNKVLLPSEITNYFKGFIIREEVKAILKNNTSWTDAIDLYNKGISEEPNNASIYYGLGLFYDTYLNDNKNYAYYLKKAVDIDSTDVINVPEYYNALLENKQFNEAKQFGKTSIYLNTVSKTRQINQLFLYHYHQNQNAKALEILKDSVFENNYFYKLLLHSQMGNKNKVSEILKANKANPTQKVYVFANLKERDSLYYYLNKDDINAPNVNSRREFDLYRKEPRYLEFMKKNHLPLIDGINN